MRTRGYCVICKKYVKDFDLISCRDLGHKINVHPRDYEDWLSKDKIEESNEERKKIIQKYGFIPESFDLNHPRKVILDNYINDLARGTYPLYGWGTRTGALAQAPVVQIEQDIKMYSQKSDTIFNPMMERIPHLLIGLFHKRNVIGQDLCKKFYEHDIKKVKEKILTSQKLFPNDNYITKETEDMFLGVLNNCKVELHLGDSRKLDFLKDESVDFIITSPPYWDISIYGDEPEQIGTKTTYERFLEDLKTIMRECFRVLKKGKFISLQVNDFRKGRFYFYHNDCINMMLELNFEPHDIRVYQTGRLGSIFASQLEKQKRSSKTHEYIIIFKKPEDFVKKEKIKKSVSIVDTTEKTDEFTDEEINEMITKHRGLISRNGAVKMLKHRKNE